MPNTKDIRNKIASVQNTKKITNAMQMVATSKMRKTNQQMDASRPYSDSIRQIMSHMSKNNGGLVKNNIFVHQRPVKKVTIVVVSSDRGLCGALNTNLFKLVVQEISKYNSNNVTVNLALVGNKAIGFFKNLGVEIIAQLDSIGDTIDLEAILPFVGSFTNNYEELQSDLVVIAFNRFVNTMVQKPIVEQLIPLPHLANDSVQEGGTWDYIIEDEQGNLISELIKRYIEAYTYNSLNENLACEQAARMVAMKAATDNAGKLIDELKLEYNKVRQAGITNELNEIVSGAAAV